MSTAGCIISLIVHRLPVCTLLYTIFIFILKLPGVAWAVLQRVLVVNDLPPKYLKCSNTQTVRVCRVCFISQKKWVQWVMIRLHAQMVSRLPVLVTVYIWIWTKPDKVGWPHEKIQFRSYQIFRSVIIFFKSIKFLCFINI